MWEMIDENTKEIWAIKKIDVFVEDRNTRSINIGDRLAVKKVDVKDGIATLYNPEVPSEIIKIYLRRSSFTTIPPKFKIGDGCHICYDNGEFEKGIIEEMRLNENCWEYLINFVTYKENQLRLIGDTVMKSNRGRSTCIKCGKPTEKLELVFGFTEYCRGCDL